MHFRGKNKNKKSRVGGTGKKLRKNPARAKAAGTKMRVTKKYSGAKKPRTMKEALKGTLTKKEFTFLRGSFDTLGNIAILEIPDELRHREKIIGNALLSVNPSLETVCVKTGAHEGEFRIEPVKVIAGKRNKVATYKEHGCTFRISLGKGEGSCRGAVCRRRPFSNCVCEKFENGEGICR